MSTAELIEINKEIDKLSEFIDVSDPNNDEDKQLLEYCVYRLKFLDSKIKDMKYMNKRQHLKLIK